MANFYKSEVITAMREQALVPVFYHPDLEVVLGIIGACTKGGSRLVEFTNRGEGAADLFGEVIKVCRKRHPEVMVGVGSVRDEITAGIYIGKGADFVVGPTFNPRIAEICNRHAVPYSPGCGSATEISNAEAAGSEIIKVFPGTEVGGPEFFKAIHGPAARTQMMPTGGVDTTAESLQAWLVTGEAAALGVGSNLVRKELVAKKDFAAIEADVRRVIGMIQAIRMKMLAAKGVVFLGVHHVGLSAGNMAATVKLLTDVCGFHTVGEPGAATTVAGAVGAMEVGPADVVKEPGHLALEVTDIGKALAELAKVGVKPDGEIKLRPDKTARIVYLAAGAFGLAMRVHLYCLYSEGVEALAKK